MALQEAEKEAERRKKHEHQNRLDKASELEENETLNEMRKRVQDNKKKGKKRDRSAHLENSNNDNNMEEIKRSRQSSKLQSFIKPE